MTGRTVRAAVLVVAGLGLLWLSMASAVSLVLGRANPVLARRFGLPSAEGEANEALAIAAAQPSPSAARIADATRLAQAALRREPFNVSAVAALGTLASLQTRVNLASRLFGYSERLSRRNVVTELWLIEDRVRQGDVAGALIHYDRLMRVTPSFRSTLIPILVAASSDPAIARVLARIMAQRPDWWTDALGPLIFQSPKPAITLPILLQGLHLRADNDQERSYLAAVMTRLASAGAFDQAYALYLQSGGAPSTGTERVRNGGFENDNRLPPFDWELHNEAGRAAVIQLRQAANAGKALFLYVDADHSGEFARQLLLLTPGRYRLSLRAGDIAGDELQRPRVSVSCAAGNVSTPFLNLRLPAAGNEGKGSQADVAVPAGCPAQWLTVSDGPGSDAQDPSWIDEVSVKLLK